MTTKEVYDTLIGKSDLHSIPKLLDNVVIWNLYTDAYIQAYCNGGDTCIEIVSNSGFSGSLMHWHPDEGDIIDELYALGKKGNVLVLKKSILGTSTFYLGPPEEYPFPDNRRLSIGKKKWDSGKLIYLVQK
jgi:hypothetical protein